MMHFHPDTPVIWNHTNEKKNPIDTSSEYFKCFGQKLQVGGSPMKMLTENKECVLCHLHFDHVSLNIYLNFYIFVSCVWYECHVADKLFIWIAPMNGTYWLSQWCLLPDRPNVLCVCKCLPWTNSKNALINKMNWKIKKWFCWGCIIECWHSKHLLLF